MYCTILVLGTRLYGGNVDKWRTPFAEDRTLKCPSRPMSATEQQSSMHGLHNLLHSSTTEAGLYKVS